MISSTQTHFVPVINEIERIQISARKKMETINEFYSQNNGNMFRHPMNIYTGNVGGDNRNNFLEQHNAFFIAFNFYYYFSTPGLIPFLERPQTLAKIIDYILNHHVRPLIKPSSAQQDSLISELFYPAFLEFIVELTTLKTLLEKISKEPDAWLNTLKVVFREQCESLITRGKFTPEMFEQVLKLVDKSLTDSEFELDIDELIKLKNCFSIYGDSSEVYYYDSVERKMVRQGKDPQKSVEKLALYLGTNIKSRDIVNLYHNIFLEVVETHCALATAEAVTLAKKSGRWQPTNFQAHNQQHVGADENTETDIRAQSPANI